MGLVILLHHTESILLFSDPSDSEAKLWKNKYTEIGPVLDVKVGCHHNVYGTEIQIASTSGSDNTQVRVAISRSPNRYVDELRYRESENLPEEVAHECMQDQDQDQEQFPRWKVR